MNPSEGVREIEKEAEKIVGALILKEKPSIKKLEELLSQESQNPVEILPDGSIAVGWRKDLIVKITDALTQAEKRSREKKCDLHPEGGKRHDFIFCQCDIERAEKRGAEWMREEAVKIAYEHEKSALEYANESDLMNARYSEALVIKNIIRNLTYEKKEAKNAKTN